jgi:hypothetical protein
LAAFRIENLKIIISFKNIHLIRKNRHSVGILLRGGTKTPQGFVKPIEIYTFVGWDIGRILEGY